MHSPPKISLATPCYGGMAHAIYLRSLLALRPACAAQGVQLELNVGGGEALIGRGRAAMMARFLEGDATHLLFVDADIGFDAAKVFRLLRSGLEVVGGAYPRKRLGPYATAPELELDPLPEAEASARDGFRKVAAVGAGFLMITRQAAERIRDGYPQLRARLGDLKGAAAAEAVMIFDSLIDPETGRYLADHQAFCRRWRDLGGEVWADLTGGLSHVGDVVLSAPAPHAL